MNRYVNGRQGDRQRGQTRRELAEAAARVERAFRRIVGRTDALGEALDQVGDPFMSNDFDRAFSVSPRLARRVRVSSFEPIANGPALVGPGIRRLVQRLPRFKMATDYSGVIILHLPQRKTFHGAHSCP